MREAITLALVHMRMRASRCIGAILACAIGVLGFGVMVSLAFGMGSYCDDLEKRMLTSVPLTLTCQEYSLPDVSTKVGPDTLSDETLFNDGSLAMAMKDSQASAGEEPLYQLAPLLDVWACDTAGVTSVQTLYDLSDNLYVKTDDAWRQAIPDGLFAQAGIGGDSLFRSLISDESDVLDERYVLRCGRLPKSDNEVIVVTQPDGNLSDAFLSAMGLVDSDQLTSDASGDETDSGHGTSEIPLANLMALDLKVAEGWAYQVQVGSTWHDARDEPQYLQLALDAAVPVEVVGVVTPRYAFEGVYDTGFVGYRPHFNASMMQLAASSAAVRAQEASSDVDLWTGKPFGGTELAQSILARGGISILDEQKMAYLGSLTDTRVLALLDALGTSEEELLSRGIAAFSEEDLADAAALSYNEFVRMIDKLAPSELDDGYTQRMRTLDSPSIYDVGSIRVYTDTLDARRQAKHLVDDFNESQRAMDAPIVDIQPTPELDMYDQATRVMGLVLLVLGIISALVVAAVIVSTMLSFAAERTREIGCLRSLGMGRAQVSGMFVFEALCIGLVASLVGAAFAGLVVDGLDDVVADIIGIRGLFAFDPFVFGIIVSSSLGICCLAALAPALHAAWMDPVRALSGSPDE